MLFLQVHFCYARFRLATSFSGVLMLLMSVLWCRLFCFLRTWWRITHWEIDLGFHMELHLGCFLILLWWWALHRGCWRYLSRLWIYANNVGSRYLFKGYRGANVYSDRMWCIIGKQNDVYWIFAGKLGWEETGEVW